MCRSLSKRAALALLLCAGAAGAQAPAAPPPGKPAVIALVAAVGDQISIVRQREAVGSRLEPFTRRTLPLNGPTLNLALLRGLAQGIAQEEPQAQRVLLRWTPPADAAQALAEASGASRDELMLQALLKHLAALPERAQWDRIEALLPKHFQAEMRGMAGKLSGIGIYVQPLKSEQLEISEQGLVATGVPADGDFRTIDPKTGERGNASTYVAPYVYFERVTLDARTLQVLARKRQFDNIKYNDPNSAAIDVFDQMPPTELLGRLLELAERSAYQSVRGKASTVETTAPQELPASAASR